MQERPDGTPWRALCPFFDRYGYQAQRQRKADVWFVAHEMLFTEKPNAIGEPAVVIVDESAWHDGLDGVQGQPITLALDTLAADSEVPGCASCAAWSRTCCIAPRMARRCARGCWRPG